MDTRKKILDVGGSSLADFETHSVALAQLQAQLEETETALYEARMSGVIDATKERGVKELEGMAQKRLDELEEEKEVFVNMEYTLLETLRVANKRAETAELDTNMLSEHAKAVTSKFSDALAARCDAVETTTICVEEKLDYTKACCNGLERQCGELETKVTVSELNARRRVDAIIARTVRDVEQKNERKYETFIKNAEAAQVKSFIYPRMARKDVL